MKQLAELVPLILFFIAYQMKGDTVDIGGWSYTFDGIFSATAVLIIATVVQVLLTWIFTRELEVWDTPNNVCTMLYGALHQLLAIGE